MKPPLTDQQRAVARSWLAMIDAMLRELGNDIPLRKVQAFFTVANDEGQSVRHYARQLKESEVTFGRNLLDIGERDRKMNKGAGLIDAHQTRRVGLEKAHYLSKKGRALLAAIAAKMESAK